MIFAKLIVTSLTILIFLYMGYYFIISLIAYFHSPEQAPKRGPQNRFLILIPAKNEETVISIPCKDLNNQSYPSNLYDTYVIADGCTDNTASVAMSAGAKVISDNQLDKLVDRHGVGKSRTLDGGLQVLKDSWDNYNYLIVIDSDNNVSSNFLEELNNWALRYNSPEAMQAKLLSKDNNDKINIVNNGLNTSFKRSAKFQQEVESKFGCASLLGTGFATKMSIISKLGGFRFHTLVEDEFEELYILMQGGCVKFVNSCFIVNENYSSFEQSNRGMKRWSKGSFQCFLILILPALINLFARPSVSAMHVLARLSTLSKATQILLMWGLLLANITSGQFLDLSLIALPGWLMIFIFVLNIIMSANIIIFQTFIVLIEDYSFAKALWVLVQVYLFSLYYNIINVLAVLTFWKNKWQVSTHGKIGKS